MLTRYAIINKIGDNCFRITFTGVKANRENFQLYLDDLELCFVDRKPITMLFDATKAVIPGFQLQRKQADWMRIHYVMIQKYCLGTAYIINRATIRLVLDFIFSFQNQPVDYKVFKTERSGLRWLDELHGYEKVDPS